MNQDQIKVALMFFASAGSSFTALKVRDLGYSKTILGALDAIYYLRGMGYVERIGVDGETGDEIFALTGAGKGMSS